MEKQFQAQFVQFSRLGETTRTFSFSFVVVLLRFEAVKGPDNAMIMFVMNGFTLLSKCHNIVVLSLGVSYFLICLNNILYLGTITFYFVSSNLFCGQLVPILPKYYPVFLGNNYVYTFNGTVEN